MALLPYNIFLEIHEMASLNYYTESSMTSQDFEDASGEFRNKLNNYDKYTRFTPVKF